MRVPQERATMLLRRGHNIGARIVDEFLAKARITKCGSFRDTTEIIARQAFPMFLSVQATVDEWNPDGTECRMVRIGGFGVFVLATVVLYHTGS